MSNGNFYPPQPQPMMAVPPPAPEKKKRPVGLIIGASVAGLVAIGAVSNMAGGSRPTAATATSPSASVASTSVADETADDETADDEDTDETSTTEDQTFKYGQKANLTMDGVVVTLSVGTPKRSSNMFDKDNAEIPVKVCNRDDEAVDDLSANTIGLYAEDNNGGTYDTDVAYRKPEFPAYDGKRLRAGKCLSGWISFEDAWGAKGLHINLDVGDAVFTWKK